jgi:hypothetical protein
MKCLKVHGTINMDSKDEKADRPWNYKYGFKV